MNRIRVVLLVGTFIPFCWLAMQAVHELGHVAAALATGGKVTQILLHPLAISRTDVVPNPRPLVVCWAGPLVGAFLPSFAWLAARAARCRGLYMFRFFAGFCLIANGAYIGIGAFGGIGDAGELLSLGMPAWALIAFGLLTTPAGLWMWHGLGKDFKRAGWRAVETCVGLLIGIVLVECGITYLI